jgi:hypothetical protein
VWPGICCTEGEEGAAGTPCPSTTPGKATGHTNAAKNGPAFINSTARDKFIFIVRIESLLIT